ncbi:class I adenylate-forming enzyme family protein [Mycolicibacterium baixiangningiae]|uniref:class I adenylate-forming enzyme family protein n=1 Tax=Mycolicibacterium baixiangningiae TaxID=2761578 RepID=UPI001865F4A7|nr:class I adenylate-forming enzyme family protein [Mycolicibacterium baixiangningiae]
MSADPTTVAAVLRQQARARGTQSLLVCDDERLTYGDAERRSAHLARHLIALGIGKGSHVGVLYPNGARFVVAMLAAARIGAVVVPFPTMATTAELHAQLLDSDVELLLTAASYRSHDYVEKLSGILGDVGSETIFSAAVPQLRRVLSGVDGAETAAPALDAFEDDVDGADVLAIVYTSGSTGAPKGAIHTHTAMLTHQRNLNGIRGLTPTDKLFCNSPFFWIGGFAFGLLATLTAGATLVCSNATDAARTLDLLEAERPNVTNGFTAGIAHLTRDPSFAARDLSALRRGNLYPIMAPDTRPADPALRHNMLGLTEAGSVVLLSGDESDQPEHRRGSFGRPAPGFDIRIVDPDDGGPVSTGTLGEMCLRGPYLMQRYHRRSREECFDADGWFHTGDLVRIDADGYVYFIGRRDSMIKTAGANVAAAEVEAALARADVTAYVMGIPDTDRGQIVAAVVVLDDGATFDEVAVRERLTAELSAYKVPRKFAVLRRSEVPLRSSGKVDMAALEKVFDA